MPFEYLRMRVFAACASPTRSTSSFACVRAAPRLMPGELARELEELERRQVIVEVRVLRQEADVLAALRRAGRPAEQERLAARRRQEPSSMRSVVVLPAPFGPSSPKTAPSGTSSVTDGRRS
jgi:hypothetical protein